MNKRFIKTQLKGVTVHGTKDVGTRTVDLLMGEHPGEYVRGDIMDANAVTQAFDELKGDVDESHDTLEKLETAIAAKQDAGEYAVLNSEEANKNSYLRFSSTSNTNDIDAERIVLEDKDADRAIKISSTGITAYKGEDQSYSTNIAYAINGETAVIPHITFSTNTDTRTVYPDVGKDGYNAVYVTMLAGDEVPTYTYYSDGTKHTENMQTNGASIYYASKWYDEIDSVTLNGNHSAMIYFVYERPQEH